MAKPNYAYEKRQRELEKKQKKEDKALKKGAGTHGGPQDVQVPAGQESPATATADKSAH
jgi:hypothetical protein